MPAARVQFTLRRFCTALIFFFHAFYVSCTVANYFDTESTHFAYFDF